MLIKIMCNICNQYNCCCNSTVVNRTDINSDQAGRDGLSAKATVIKTGRLPANATDEQFADYIKGDKGAKGDPGINGINGLDGQQEYSNTEW